MTLAPLWAQGFNDHMWGFDGGWGWWWAIAMILLWVVVIAAIVWLVRSLAGRDDRSDRGRDSAPGESRARAILDERYARGDISTEEYRERREALR